MPRRFSTKESERIERSLIDEGVALFTVYDAKYVTVDQIADAVGISKGAFYRFHASKDELYSVCAALVHDRIQQEVRSITEACTRTPDRALRAVCRYAADLSTRYGKMIGPQTTTCARSGAPPKGTPHIDGRALISAFHEIGCVCDFSSEAIEQLCRDLCSLGAMDRERGASEGLDLLLDLCDIGSASFIRTS
jgi:AcrR family transcriptional regulator